MIEPMSEVMHLKTMLASRFVSFHDSLINSKKFSIRFLARLFEPDMKTVYGQNLHEIASLCNVDHRQLTPKIVKSKLKYREVSDEDQWRVRMGKELLELRDKETMHLPGFTADEQAEVLHYICTA